MNSFYKGGSELSTGKASSCSNQIKSKKIGLVALKLVAHFRLYFTSIDKALAKHCLSTDEALSTQLLRKRLEKGKTYCKGACQLLYTYLIIGSRLSAVKLVQKPIKSNTFSSGFFLTNFAPTSAVHAFGHQSSGAVPLLFPEGDPKPTRRNTEQRWEKGRSWSGIGRAMVDYRSAQETYKAGYRMAQETHKVGYRSAQETYKAGYRSAQQTYKVGYRSAQETYKAGYRMAQQTYKVGYRMALASPLLSPCYAQGRYKKCTRHIQQKQAFQPKGNSDLTHGVELKRSVLRCFKSIYEVQGCQVNTLLSSIVLIVQRALKCFSFIASHGRPFRMMLIRIFLMIVFQPSYFSVKALKSIRAIAVLGLMVSMFSLSAQTPRKDSGADGLSNLMALKPGDKIPDAVWNMPLELNYFNGKKKTIKFSELKGKLILLDFWSTGCPACISGIPNLELIRNRFKGEVEILMINSKRNKDTPKRIENRFKKYKSDFNYTPAIPTLLDDTLFTELFKHNTLPTQAVINTEGKFLALISGTDQLTERNIRKILYENNNPLKNTGIYFNKIDGRRNFDVVISDTTGLGYSSTFSGYRDHYIPIGPLWKAQKNKSLLIMGNLSLHNFMAYLFQDELNGFSWTDYVFDSKLGLEFKYKLFKTASENTYWYQFYRNDSISETKAKEAAKQDFMRYFDVAVKRRTDSIDIYQVSYGKAIEKIKTKGQMVIIRVQELDQEILYQNVPIKLFLGNLFYLLEYPLYQQENESFRVDITIPAGSAYWSESQKLAFLRDNGIILTHVKVKREFPYIYSLK